MKESKNATKRTTKNSTARVKLDNDRIDRLKEQHMSTPADISSERTRLLMKVYEETAGSQQIIRRAKSLAYILDNKELYIDENLFGKDANLDCHDCLSRPRDSKRAVLPGAEPIEVITLFGGQPV